MTIATNRIALSLPNNSYAQRRTDLMHFTAAIPLLAIKTFSMTLFPPNLLTNSAGVATYNTKYNGSSKKTTELEFEYYLYYHNTSLSQTPKVEEGNTNSLILTGVCLGLKLTDN